MDLIKKKKKKKKNILYGIMVFLIVLKWGEKKCKKEIMSLEY